MTTEYYSGSSTDQRSTLLPWAYGKKLKEQNKIKIKTHSFLINIQGTVPALPGACGVFSFRCRTPFGRDRIITLPPWLHVLTCQLASSYQDTWEQHLPRAANVQTEEGFR